MGGWWRGVDAAWEGLRGEALEVLQREARLPQIVKLVGPDVLPDAFSPRLNGHHVRTMAQGGRRQQIQVRLAIHVGMDVEQLVRHERLQLRGDRRVGLCELPVARHRYVPLLNQA